jgi:2-oxoglutarate dehydrogenase E2 component (dihydrolipoamide succinyltransferase)
MPTNVEVPSLGESVSEAVLVKWLKGDGEVVAAAEPICELETDKANVDLPSPVAGVLRRVKEEGDTVHIGETIARIDESGAPTAPARAPAPKGDGGAAKAETDNLSPAVRKLVDEHKLDPSSIKGTGPGGRITKEDVQKHLAAAEAAKASQQAAAEAQAEAEEEEEAPPAPPPKPATVSAPPREPQKTLVEKMSFDPDGTKRVPMSKIRKRIAATLVAAQQTAAMLTTFNEVDLTNVIEIRSKYKDKFADAHGVSLGFMSFFSRAVVTALKQFPRINAFIEGDDIVYHDYVHLGIAVSTDRGLAVPVLRNAHKLSFAEIESEIKRLATAVRDGRLAIEELTGGTFTITNGGVFGSLLSTPILNPPQSAILGMHAIQKRPVVVNDKIEIRSMMYIALTYDHRLIDGRESVSFLVRVKELLEDPARLMLEV